MSLLTDAYSRDTRNILLWDDGQTPDCTRDPYLYTVDASEEVPTSVEVVIPSVLLFDPRQRETLKNQ